MHFHIVTSTFYLPRQKCWNSNGAISQELKPIWLWIWSVNGIWHEKHFFLSARILFYKKPDRIFLRHLNSSTVVLSGHPVGTYPLKINPKNLTFIRIFLPFLVLTHIYSIASHARDILYIVKLWTLKTLIISPVLHSFLDLQTTLTVQLINWISSHTFQISKQVRIETKSKLINFN